MRQIHTDDAPTPRGHYSQGIAHNGVLYVSVQLPLVPGEEPANEAPPVADQARQAIENVLAIVRAAGGSEVNLLRVTVYVSDIKHWPSVNHVYEEMLGDARPARGVVPTGKLHLGYDVAVDAIAALPT